MKRRATWILVGLAGVGVLAGVLWWRGQAPASTPAPIVIHDPAVVALIDKLCTAEAPLGDARQWLGPEFVLPNDGSTTGRGLAPKEYSALVAEGATAVADLLEHLDDARETKLGALQIRMLAGEVAPVAYDPRYRDPSRVLALSKTLSPRKFDASGRYTLRVGDLCYAALGQIVNRYLSPTNGLEIYSPVEHSDIVRAAQIDWIGLTAAQHRAFLESDVAEETHFGAAPRLCYYYPAAGDEAIERMLARPIVRFDPSEWETRMMDAKSPEGRHAVVAAFKRRYPAADPKLMARVLSDLLQRAQGEEGADKLLEVQRKLFPSVDLYQVGAVSTATLANDLSLLEAIRAVKSARIDDAACNLFAKMSHAPPPGFDISDLDELFKQCAKRGGSHQQKAVYRTYANKRLEAIANSDQASAKEEMEIFRQLLKMLGD